MSEPLSFTVPVAAPRWELSGPAGASLDSLVAALIGSGVSVECIAPATRYRLEGPRNLLEVLSDELASAGADVAVKVEMPPTDTINMTSALRHEPEFRRTVTIHGQGAAMSYVARAIDRGLSVASVGVNRWAITGRSAALVDWMAAIYQKSSEEVLALWRWTPESIAAEDAVQHSVAIKLPAVAVEVKLPDRRTTSEITRNQAGEITQLVQLETTA